MLPNTAGTPIKAMLDGIWYELMADCDPTADLSGETVEGNATSGSTVFKHTKKVKTIKGVDVKMSISEYNLACEIKAALKVSLPQGLMYADLSVVTAPGRSSFGEHSGANGKMSAEIIFDDLVIVAG